MSDRNESHLSPQDEFILSLPLEMQQRFLSDKHLDLPETFSHALIVDNVRGTVYLNPVNAAGGLTWHPNSHPSEQATLTIRSLVKWFAAAANADNLEMIALKTAEKISEVLGPDNEKFTGLVPVWIFEQSEYGKVRRVVTKKEEGDVQLVQTTEEG